MKDITRQIKVGKIRIGGGVPIVIQSMTKTDTKDIASTIRQIKELEKAGCELVRLSVKDFAAASAIKEIKKKTNMPLIADVHFDYRLALSAIENGASKIRLNPGNIYKEEEIIRIAGFAKKRKVSIRVGANSGSLRNVKSGAQADDIAKRMVDSVLDYIKILEKARFYDIIVSLKASDVLTTIDACRRFSKKSRYPLHLGVTAAGPVSAGTIKSSIGIGVLLSEGIGDTIRVSLTGGPCEEVIVAKGILQALDLRRFGPEIISCPTCGRTEVDLKSIVEKIEGYISTCRPCFRRAKFPKIAIMGCEVNGPGEAKEADIGIACGKNGGVIFKKGKVFYRVEEKDIVSRLLYEIKKTSGR